MRIRRQVRVILRSTESAFVYHMTKNARTQPFLVACVSIMLLGGWVPLCAQDYGTIRGQVMDSATGAPLADVLVGIDSLVSAATTDRNGRFVLPTLPHGSHRIMLRAIGYRPAEHVVLLTPDRSVALIVYLGKSPVVLSDIVVTAEVGGGSATIGSVGVVRRDAVEHVQASSLADVLQLVPGQLAENPLLGSARQSLLRQVPTDADAARANALGTGLVIDGVPVSNNANLQTDLTILNSAPGTLPPFSSVANRGPDLRHLPVDNIESLEVIRGVPSARHGDLTTGAILVTSRAGARRPELRARANPQTLELTAVAGWGDVRRGRRAVSLDADWLAANDDPRQDAATFGRLTLQAAWTERWFPGERLITTTRLALFGADDELRRDADDPGSRSSRLARDRGLRASHTGRLAFGSGHLGWTLGVSVQHQTGRYEDVIVRDIYPVSDATRDTTVVGRYGESEYLNRTTVDGRPLNLYGRIEIAGATAGRNGGHAPTLGVEWRWDQNFGGGRRFDPTRPPRQNYSVGERPRRFGDIPGYGMLSAYAEDVVSGRLWGRAAVAQVGVRFDNIQPTTPFRGRYGTIVAPRLNGRLEIVRGMHLRAGWGITAKAPTLAQLFPGPRYFDLVSFNHFAADPSERLTVVTTRVVTPATGGLRAYRAHKAEVGGEVRAGRVVVSAVGFLERTRHAFGVTRVPVVLSYPRYEAVEMPPGRPPILGPDPVAIDTFIGAYDVARPTRSIANRGVEVVVELPEWSALRTSLQLNASWTGTTARDEAESIDTDALFRSATAPVRLGIYGAGAGSEARQLITSLRLIHRLPHAGLVGSLLVQTLWQDDDRPLGLTEYPVGFVDRAGAITRLSESAARSPEYADLHRPIGANARQWERRPPLWLLNLRLMKSLPSGLRFAFFANNLLADRPLYPSRRAPPGQTVYQRRNGPLFFGVECLFILPG